MQRLTENKIVLITRPTRLTELIARFNTVAQARFYVEHLGADFSDYQREDERYRQALAETRRILDQLGRVQVVDRRFLPNYVFGPEDVIVALGQDGLVANTLKYLQGQPVLGVNPDPARWDGQLLPVTIGDLEKILPEVFRKGRPTKLVTMAQAKLNNGQTMYAVNDLFIGPKSHGSARYHIQLGQAAEDHSSSGVIVSTGLGSTGWFRSLLTGAAAITQSVGTTLARQTVGELPLDDREKPTRQPRRQLTAKSSFAWDADFLFFTVREPFPSKTTAATLVFGRITPHQPLTLVSQMAENGVIFSDGIEPDFVEFNSGARAVISLAERKGRLVI
jgi:NAD kinase